MTKHHVKKHHWHNGILKTVEHFFDTLAEALDHAKSSNAHTVKVYNESSEMVFSHSTELVVDQSNIRETYA
jgi:hypothetical protein